MEYQKALIKKQEAIIKQKLDVLSAKEIFCGWTV